MAVGLKTRKRKWRTEGIADALTTPMPKPIAQLSSRMRSRNKVVLVTSSGQNTGWGIAARKGTVFRYDGTTEAVNRAPATLEALVNKPAR
jgi:hypothetical protein